MVLVRPAPTIFRVFSVALLLGLSALTPGCKKSEGATAAPQRPPAPVRVASAVERDVPVYLEQIGKSTAPEVVSIQAQVSGQITKIHFTEGSYLNRGDPLFTIDPRPYQAQLDSAEASLAQNKAARDLAAIEFARVEKLIKTQAITKQEYDSRKNAVAIAEAQVRLSEAAIKTAKLNLEHCFITSPIDGRAGQRLVDLGNVVTPGGAGTNVSLLVVQRIDPIYADFTITENDLTAVQRSMAEGTVKVQVRLPDEADGSREGALTFLDNAVQDGTGTVKLRATLPNADHHFWPGRFVKVRLVLSTQKAAVLVASAAPQTSAKGRFVFVVKDDSTAEFRPVTLGQRQGDLVAVTEGVKAGERVIVAGQMLVAPGGKVRIEEPPPEGGAGTKPAGASADQGKAAGGSNPKAGGAAAAGSGAQQGNAASGSNPKAATGAGAGADQGKAVGATAAGASADQNKAPGATTAGAGADQNKAAGATAAGAGANQNKAARATTAGAGADQNNAGGATTAGAGVDQNKAGGATAAGAGADQNKAGGATAGGAGADQGKAGGAKAVGGSGEPAKAAVGANAGGSGRAPGKPSGASGDPAKSSGVSTGKDPQ